ncbi:MAG: alpha/beta fold hydrolase [Candidatus Thorarchaeota archaeon]
MAKAKANNIEIEFETFGNTTDSPLILINGLGSQMINWDEGFIQCLIERGFFVIRFDNRDVGLSTKVEEAGEPDIMQAYLAIQRGELFVPPYTVEDMADDTIGLLGFLKIEKAHICGFSMGGTLAQVIGFRHPTRVLSLTCISSTTGNPEIPRGDPEVGRVMATPAPASREGYVKYYVKLRSLQNGPIFPFDKAKNRNYAERAYDRCYYPPGIIRQSLAIMVSGNLKPKLSSIQAPTLVIHGTDDPVINVEGSKDIHEAIPGSKLLIIEGMGHSLPTETWVQITDAIQANALKF